MHLHSGLFASELIISFYQSGKVFMTENHDVKIMAVHTFSNVSILCLPIQESLLLDDVLVLKCLSAYFFFAFFFKQTFSHIIRFLKTCTVAVAFGHTKYLKTLEENPSRAGH